MGIDNMQQESYLFCFEYDTPLGRFRIEATDSALTRLIFVNDATPLPHEGTIVSETPLINRAYLELLEYMEGRRIDFDLPLAPVGTAFQQAVWAELQKIPYGRTASYQDIARRLGKEKAARAVGGANNKNPLAIFIPCHRVIGKNGRLTGYAGGLDMKSALLALEKQNSVYLDFTQEEVNILSAKDEALAAYMATHPIPLRRGYTDLFYGLVDSVVSQQISNAARAAIMLRLSYALWPITPQGIAAMSEDALRALGLSVQKARCIQTAARLILSGELDLDALKTADDNQVIRQLTSIKGIGAYTAEMLLIFGLHRKNVISGHDLGIKKGLMRLYGLDSLSKQEFATYKERFAPLGTLASLYLWALAAE